MTSWWYALAFVIVTALVVIAGPWLCHVFDARADQRDLELWMQMPGATR